MKTKSFKEILKETIQRNCTDDYDGMFLFFESSVIEAHNEYASQLQQEWIPVEVRLPETTIINFITAKDSSDRIIFLDHRELIWYHYGIGIWYADTKIFKEKYPDLTIIAWQPIIIPKPYNPKQS